MKNGPPMIETLFPYLQELFGLDQMSKIKEIILSGKDSYIVIPKNIILSYEEEIKREKENLPPIPRNK